MNYERHNFLTPISRINTDSNYSDQSVKIGEISVQQNLSKFFVWFVSFVVDPNQIFVLMPQARMRHQPRTASKMANNPATTKIKPSQSERSTSTMPVMRQIVPMTPRAMRPVRFKLGWKKWLTTKI